jgi:hypothetical protein
MDYGLDGPRIWEFDSREGQDMFSSSPQLPDWRRPDDTESPI